VSTRVRQVEQEPAPPAGRVGITQALRAGFTQLLSRFAPTRAAAPTAEPDTSATPARRGIVRAAYSGAEKTRFNVDWRSGTNSSDSDIASDGTTLRGRARALARDNAYIERFLDLLCANVIGPDGIRHQAQVLGRNGKLDEELNDYIERKWLEWARGPVTIDGRMSLNAFMALQLETSAVDGEAFTRTFIGARYRHGLALQPLDPDLVPMTISRLADRTGNEIRLGVEVDEVGRRVAYHVFENSQYMPGAKLYGPLRVSAGEMLHHYRVRRAHQTRGVTWLARVMTDTQDLGAYDEAVIVGARAGANTVAFAQWKDPTVAPTPSANDEDARQPLNMEMNAGTLMELDPGLEVVPFDPSQPSGVYADFTKTVLRKIAAGLKVSYAALTGDLREVSYSGHKIGLLNERDMYKMLQEWWIETFLQPVYERWLEAAVLSGELQLPTPDWRAYTAVSWTPRRWPWTEPQREIVAAKEELALGLTSRQRILAEQSDGDFKKLIAELQQEAEMARTAGVSVAGTNVTAAGATGGTIGDPGADGSGDGSGDAAAASGADGSSARAAAPANRIAALTNGHAKH
jgi:lambda family phage portal protein